MLVYHGSGKIIQKPLNTGKTAGKDYGPGFYLTQNEELAREWASIEKSGGFLNIYELETDDIAILDLSGEGYGIRNWAALVTYNRSMCFSDQEAVKRAGDLVDKYLPNTSSYDVIKGYRADCSYYSILRSYLEGNIPLNELEEAVISKDLGEQIVIRSEYALEKLTFLDYEAVDGSLYYPKRMRRDMPADKADIEGSLLRPYPKPLVTDAMQLLGEFSAYTSAKIPETSPDSLFSMFIVSGLASRFEKGDPALIRGMSGAELAHKVVNACGISLPEDKENFISDGASTALPFWCGKMLSYLQWFKGISFSELLRLLPVSRLRSMYQDLKDMPIEVAAVTIDKRLALRQSSSTKLQTIRKRTGLSQKELALASGVNVRTLQQYERRDKDIKKAAAGKLIALSRVMHCSPESLLD